MFSLRFANSSDINQIMEIEKNSFISETQEDINVFLKRIEIFPQGFVLLIDAQTDKIIGYFCSELWDSMPSSEKSFSVGHDISSLHSNSGKILYISSFAIFKEYRGNGFGRNFFSEAIKFICSKIDVSKLALLVNEKWINAHHIYLDYGFSDVCVINKAFIDGNGILMQKVYCNK